jgi:hypothetical protein
MLFRFAGLNGFLAAWGLLVLLYCRPAQAYSQFTHLELIDLIWADQIKPLLLERYKGTDERALSIAHAYAYGGSLIQDIGYYPFGKTLFSDLAHHVRSGDFVAALIRNSRDVNELAFSIGALSHYVGDSIGHSEATNPAVAETFPELKAKFGPIVTFEDGPIAHVRTEFGFDVAQSVWKRYAPRAYRKHIGFRVARPLLYRAFRETYGLRAGGILGPGRSALTTYRWGVRKLLPAFLRAEGILLAPRLPVENPSAARAKFLSVLSRADYAQHGSPRYEGPGVGAHLIALLIRIIPKFGILKILAVKAPNAPTEDLFLLSMNNAIERFRGLLSLLTANHGVSLALPNLNLDTGAATAPGTSRAADATYAALASLLAREPAGAPASAMRDVLAFYEDLTAPITTRANPKEWRKLLVHLQILRRLAE